jgi:hypothetical protein
VRERKGNPVNPGNTRGETPERERLAVADWMGKGIEGASSWGEKIRQDVAF